MGKTICMTMVGIDPAVGGPARSIPGLINALTAYSDINTELYLGNLPRKHTLSDQNLALKNIKDLRAAILEKQQVYGSEILIHNHGIWHPINHYASRVARRSNIPIIISPRGMLEPWAVKYKKIKKKIAWYCYQLRDLKRASLIHATSTMEAENIQRYGLKLPIAIVPNGVILPHDGKKRENNNYNNRKIALFLSRIHPKKGLINLVRAWQKVLPTNWKVIIAGPDESNHKNEIIVEINRCKLQDSFDLIGQVDDRDKWELFKRADLFILPTFSENFGIVVAEALACGTPVITTKGAPWADLIHYKCGWWIDTDVNSLSLAITQAVNLSCEARYEMGRNGRKLVADKYSWDKIAKEMGKVYSWVLRGGIPPDCILLPQ